MIPRSFAAFAADVLKAARTATNDWLDDLLGPKCLLMCDERVWPKDAAAHYAQEHAGETVPDPGTPIFDQLSLEFWERSMADDEHVRWIKSLGSDEG